MISRSESNDIVRRHGRVRPVLTPEQPVANVRFRVGRFVVLPALAIDIGDVVLINRDTEFPFSNLSGHGIIDYVDRHDVCSRSDRGTG